MPGPEPLDEDIDILRYVKLDEGGFSTARDVNRHTSVGYTQTRNRLDDLVEEGLLKVRTVGTVNVYWPSDEGETLLSQDPD